MKYLHLIIKNLLRKKFRTFLTVGSFVVALFLFGLLTTIGKSFNQVEVAGANRLVIRNGVSIIQPLPFSYGDRVRSIEGVDEVTYFTWFGGIYQDRKNFFPNYACDPETFLEIYPEYVMSEEEFTAFTRDRQGCIAGVSLAKKFGWSVGDRIPLEGTIWQGTWEFNLRAIYDVSSKELGTNEFMFHYDYLEERRPFFKGTVGWYVVKISDPGRAAEVAEAIDREFANSPWESKTESEKAFLTGWAAQMGNIKLLMLSIGGVVFFTLMLVTGNTMAISIRERTGEFAVLKTVGFTSGGVLSLIVAESMTIAAAGGALGLLLAKGFTLGGDPTGGMLPVFYLSTAEMGGGFALALAVGLAAGLLPGAAAVRLRIVDALRRI
jgi:putative ABC transport system permease protein